MNPRLIRLVVIFFLAILVILVDLTVWKRLDIPATLVHPSLLMVAVVTARRGFVAGVAVAILAGWAFRLFSTYPGAVHPLSFILVVVAMSLLLRRVFANKSMLSFTSLILIGTVAYYIGVVSLSQAAHLFVDSSTTPAWQTWTWPLFQAGIHPLIGWAIWQLSGRAQRYATTGLKTEHSF